MKSSIKRVIHHRETFPELPSLRDKMVCMKNGVNLLAEKRVHVCVCVCDIERDGKLKKRNGTVVLLLTPHFFLLRRLCRDQKTERERKR